MFSHVTTPNVYVYKLFMLPYLSVPSMIPVSVVPTVNGARQVSLNISIDVSMSFAMGSLVCVVWLMGTCHVITSLIGTCIV